MIPQGTRVYFAIEPADMRKSFDGLAALASATLSQEPSAGGLFVFVNERCTQARVLFRDHQGWCLLLKRLDKGRFRRPEAESGQLCLETEARSLVRFLEDIDFSSRRLRRTPSQPSDGRAPSHLRGVRPKSLNV